MRLNLAVRLRQRPLVVSDWLLIALFLVSAWLIAITLAGRPEAPPPPLPAAKVQVDGALWRLPTDSGVAIGPLEGEQHSIASLADGRVHRIRAFYYDDEDLQRLATAGDADTLSNLSVLTVGGAFRSEALPQSARGEVFGPMLFGRPTVIVCGPLRRLNGEVISWCKLWGWAPDGVPIFLRYEEWRGDGQAQMRALERILDGLRVPPERKR